MKKIKNQLLILLAAAIVAGSGLPYNLNNLDNTGENPIGASDSGEKEDTRPNNGGNINRPNCDDEEVVLSE